jgi:LuxR family quorum-sensing system transcriptional regulator SolR
MNTIWEQETLLSMLKAENEVELFEAIAKAAREINFDYCAYGAKTPIPITQPKLVLHNNYSDSWRERYTASGYLNVDPTVQHAFKSSAPILWSEATFAGARDLWEDARGHDLRYGWAQASRDGTGLVGLLTLARSGEEISKSELIENEPKMLWLVQNAHASMSALLSPKYMPEAHVSLTERELEVLRWTAEGKTAAEVSMIMNISVNTVNFHVTNFTRKLSSANKVQAVVKAALCGLLS